MSVSMLRNTSGAGNSLVCKLQFICRLSSVWEPRGSRGHGLPTIFTANGTSSTSQVKGHSRSTGHRKKSETCECLDGERIKTQGFLYWGSLLRDTNVVIQIPTPNSYFYSKTLFSSLCLHCISVMQLHK